MSFIPALTVLSKSDIVSSDFWASQFSSFTPASVLLVLICAVITGVIISAVYKITYRGVLYSPQFSMVLIMLVLITAPVVMAIGSNVALSMGMVGALSIVRFRTAIKEPLDTCYMFWAITMGILLGAQQYAIALVVVVGIGINVNTEDFPEDLAEIATSLRAAAGKSFDRSRIIADIMQAFEARYAQLTACGDLRDMREAYEDRLVCKKRRINMISPAGVTSGTAEGIDDLGHLLVRMAGGSLQSVMSGEISVRNSD